MYVTFNVIVSLISLPLPLHPLNTLFISAWVNLAVHKHSYLAPEYIKQGELHNGALTQNSALSPEYIAQWELHNRALKILHDCETPTPPLSKQFWHFLPCKCEQTTQESTRVLPVQCPRFREEKMVSSLLKFKVNLYKPSKPLPLQFVLRIPVIDYCYKCNFRNQNALLEVECRYE